MDAAQDESSGAGDGPALLSLADDERAALQTIGGDALGYIEGGAGDEITLDDNVAAWRRIALRPRMLVGAGECVSTLASAGAASECPLPVLVKGILTPQDAELAIAHGAAGVIVSNHGGRQLDTVLSGADALPPIADAVAGRIDVLVDGGIRRGTDVVKALALGACAVLVGRPLTHGLAVNGAEGAQRVLEILLAEVENALALTGCPVASELDRSFVTPAPWASPAR